MDGDFNVGGKGRLKPKGFFPIRFEVIEAVPGEGFIDVSKLPFTRIKAKHVITPGGEVTHTFKVYGLFAPLLFFTMRPKLRQKLPSAIEKLCRMAEKRGT